MLDDDCGLFETWIQDWKIIPELLFRKFIYSAQRYKVYPIAGKIILSIAKQETDMEGKTLHQSCVPSKKRVKRI